MPRWIDATADQRFWQYTYPAARKLIESGEWDVCIAQAEDAIVQARMKAAAAVPDTGEHRRWTRRIMTLTRDRDNAVKERDADLAVLAEADRRRRRRAA